MRQMRKLLVLSLALIGCIAAGPIPAAMAQGSDNSAVDEYTETIPGAGGNHPTGDDRNGGGDSGNGAQLPGASGDDLRAASPDGAAVADLAEETAPATAAAGGEGTARGPSGSRGVGEGSQAREGSSPKDAGGIADTIGTVLTGSPGGSGGMGVAFPIAIIAAALGALGVLLYRRRSGDTPRSA